MSVAVLAEEIAPPAIKNAVPPQLARYTFQPGHKPLGKVGRPKGVLNSQTVLMRSAPKLAKAYVTEGCKGNATILVDARKWIMPTDADGAGNGETKMMIFIGAGDIPRQLSQDISAVLPPLPVVVDPSSALPQNVQSDVSA